MNSPVAAPEAQRLGKWPSPFQWVFLLLLSALLAAALEVADLPAALLIGPMIAGIVAGTHGATIRVARPLFGGAQAIVGCLVAASISVEIVTAFADDWLLAIAVVLATLAASSFLGWFISRFRSLPGTTAVWGSAPGGATAMVLMAGAFGADVRLVAFMQYLRVILVSLAAALVARGWMDANGAASAAQTWFPPIDWSAFGSMAAIAAAGAMLGRLARLPSPYFLGAAILGAVAHIGLGLPLQLPEWLLAASYALVGWAIGLNFTSSILRHAVRVLPQILGSIVAMMAFCGGLAWLLAHELGVDPLTAYLATSPGGLDTVAIIAAASDGVDISFVMALQSARLVFVLAFGPFIARTVSRWVRQ